MEWGITAGGVNDSCGCGSGGVAGGRRAGGEAGGGWDTPGSSPRAGGSPLGPGGFARDASSVGRQASAHANVYEAIRKPFVLLLSPRR